MFVEIASWPSLFKHFYRKFKHFFNSKYCPLTFYIYTYYVKCVFLTARLRVINQSIYAEHLLITRYPFPYAGCPIILARSAVAPGIARARNMAYSLHKHVILSHVTLDVLSGICWGWTWAATISVRSPGRQLSPSRTSISWISRRIRSQGSRPPPCKVNSSKEGRGGSLSLCVCESNLCGGRPCFFSLFLSPPPSLSLSLFLSFTHTIYLSFYQIISMENSQ